MYQVTYSTRALLIVIGLFLFSLDSFSNNFFKDNPQNLDSLAISNADASRQFVVAPGAKIKIWLYTKGSATGYFKTIDNEQVSLTVNGIEKVYKIKDIKSIKVFAGKGRQVIGGILVGVGVGALILGGVGLVAGTLAYIAGDLGAIILVTVPFLEGFGYGSYKIGDRVSGKKFKLKSRWHISKLNHSVNSIVIPF